MKTVIVMRGLPGSGKSTLIQEEYPKARVVSADNFFIDKKTGKYEYNPEHIGYAHAYCFREFLESLEGEYPLVIVDNTSTTAVEIAPYMLGAAAFGYKTRVLTVLCDPKVAAARNTHGVPESVVLKMQESLSIPLPPWWDQETALPGKKP